MSRDWRWPRRNGTIKRRLLVYWCHCRSSWRRTAVTAASKTTQWARTSAQEQRRSRLSLWCSLCGIACVCQSGSVFCCSVSWGLNRVAEMSWSCAHISLRPRLSVSLSLHSSLSGRTLALRHKSFLSNCSCFSVFDPQTGMPKLYRWINLMSLLPK